MHTHSCARSSDLVIAVSYFYDREYYDNWEHHHELGEDVDVSKYIAGGIIVFDLTTHMIKWQAHLDLSTDSTQFRAYMYSAPSIADLDGDGKLEIVVGTSVGFIYAMDAADGSTRPGFPIQVFAVAVYTPLDLCSVLLYIIVLHWLRRVRVV